MNEKTKKLLKRELLSGFLGLAAVMLPFSLTLAGCDDGSGNTGSGFVAVTDITLTSSAAVNTPLTLEAAVTPGNATNKTIVRSGTGVSDNILTAAAAGTAKVTAAITDGEVFIRSKK